MLPSHIIAGALGWTIPPPICNALLLAGCQTRLPMAPWQKVQPPLHGVASVM